MEGYGLGGGFWIIRSGICSSLMDVLVGFAGDGWSGYGASAGPVGPM